MSRPLPSITDPSLRHPTDDNPDPGAHSTLGYVLECTNKYYEQRTAVVDAENELKRAQWALDSALVNFEYAKGALTEAIGKANGVIVEDTCKRRREEPLNVPLPEGTQFTPKPEDASPAPEEKPEIGDYPWPAEKKRSKAEKGYPRY